MTDKLNNQLNKERHNKKDMLFSFDELADEGKSAKVLEKLVKIFTKAGNGVIPEDSKASAAEMSKVKRVSGVKYREIAINFLDNQSVVLRVKESGDIYQVVLNKKVVPITHQDNQAKAIDEIIGLLNAGRTKFQAALAKQKVKLPETSTTSRVNQVTKLTGIKDGLAAEIAQIKGETERMRGEMGNVNNDADKTEKTTPKKIISETRGFIRYEDYSYLYKGTYTKINDTDWGAVIDANGTPEPEQGDRIIVTTRSGEKTEKTIKKLEKKGSYHEMRKAYFVSFDEIQL